MVRFYFRLKTLFQGTCLLKSKIWNLPWVHKGKTFKSQLCTQKDLSLELNSHNTRRNVRKKYYTDSFLQLFPELKGTMNTNLWSNLSDKYQLLCTLDPHNHNLFFRGTMKYIEKLQNYLAPVDNNYCLISGMSKQWGLNLMLMQRRQLLLLKSVVNVTENIRTLNPRPRLTRLYSKLIVVEKSFK